MEGLRLVTGLQPVREAIRVHRSALKRVALEQKDSPTLEALGRFAADQGVALIVTGPNGAGDYRALNSTEVCSG